MPNPRPTQLQGITDLTVIADIKPGLIEGIFESRSYAWRLQTTLDLLDAARHASREADRLPSPFIDSVGRLRGIHFFRFAVLPPGRQLLLNVTFDGGWEPYMRSIWGPLGKMLDLIFCHCKGYPLAAASSFDDYIRWVRDHEVPSGFFYADSAATSADRTYLSRLEELQRVRGDCPDADLRAAQLALQAPQPPEPGAGAVATALRPLKALFGLTKFFGMPASASGSAVSADGGSVLLRFAQDFLSDLRRWYAQGLFDPGPFERELRWLNLPPWSRPEKQDRWTGLDASKVQAGIVQSPQAAGNRRVRGALVLARVRDARDAAGARAWLRAAATAAPGQPMALITDGRLERLDGDQVAVSVAITYPGLKALGVHANHLAALPAEFVQGMEARAGILGDLRTNHPQQWTRPRAGQTGPGSGSGPAPIDLGLVDLVIQLRTAEADAEQEGDRYGLLPRLRRWIDQHLTPTFEVLAVEPAWSNPRAGAEPAGRDHFGFVDGVSQPTLAPSTDTKYWNDKVGTGELLLGWVNDRGDGPLATPKGPPKPATPAWLDFGTFLVVRKIVQYVDRLDAAVDRAAAALVADGVAPSVDEAREILRAKLLGRRSDGQPLVEPHGAGVNNFNYKDDANGAQCPFASHVRRANPRVATDSGFPPPRIARRGMAYGPPLGQADPQRADQDERGALFLACNASIAEQFEVIQRWLAGANSSGVSSSQPDPLLGVPQIGVPAVYRFTHADKVIRVDLGDQPLCRLEWGLYAFLPSMPLLRSLESLVADPAGGKAPGALPARPPYVAPEGGPDALRQQVKAEFEDLLTRDAAWARVRAQSAAGVQKIGATVLVGGHDAVVQVLGDDGGTFSARGYGERMAVTLGSSPFGEDDVGPHGGHQRPHVGAVKQAIDAAVAPDAAFATACGFVSSRLQGQLAKASALGAPVDIVELGSALIGHLFQEWFGVAYGTGVAEVGSIEPTAEPVRCPGHFLVMARKVFSANPNPTVDGLVRLQAQPARAAVAHWVAAAPKATTAPVMKAVLAAMQGAAIDDDERNATVANVMLGLPATLLGTWAKVLVRWVADRRFWRLQHELWQAQTAGAAVDHGVAAHVLRDDLIATMAADPVADGIWRTVKQAYRLGGVDVNVDDIVWLGLGSALSPKPGDLQAAEDLLFGGVLDSSSERHAPHACPGRRLAMGALLGALAGVLQAGQWAATASPTTLTLRRALG